MPHHPSSPTPQVVALPPSDMVHKGFIRKESITPTNEKVMRKMPLSVFVYD